MKVGESWRPFPGIGGRLQLHRLGHLNLFRGPYTRRFVLLWHILSIARLIFGGLSTTRTVESVVIVHSIAAYINV